MAGRNYNKLASNKCLGNKRGSPPYPRAARVHVAVDRDTSFDEVINRFTSLDRLKRVLEFCLRFAKNCRGERTIGPIRVPELRSATTALMRWAQSIGFHDEINQLKHNKRLEAGALLSLNPFLDGNGILRVRGRIQNEEMTFDRKHPVLVAYGSRLTQLIVRDAHLKTLHGGNTLTLAYIRQNLWIIKAKRAIKQELRSCVKCFRFKAEVQQQLMGNLPTQRTTPSSPFTNTGVDFCGPYDTKISGGRGCKTRKGYIAIHLEVVSDQRHKHSWRQ